MNIMNVPFKSSGSLSAIVLTYLLHVLEYCIAFIVSGDRLHVLRDHDVPDGRSHRELGVDKERVMARGPLRAVRARGCADAHALRRPPHPRLPQSA